MQAISRHSAFKKGLTLFLATLFLVSQNSLVALADSQTELRQLYKLFSVKSVSAHYLLVIDTSLSMSNKLPTVKPAVDQLIKSVGKNDRLTLIVFDNSAKTLFRQAKKDNSKATQLVPSQANSTGKKTDMAIAFKQVISEMKKSSASLQVILFVTDGKDDPPPNSRFYPRTDKVWFSLNNQAKALKGKTVIAQGIGLEKATDAGLIKKVFSEAQTVSLSASQLKDYLSELRTQIQQQRLKAKIKQELQQGVKVSLISGQKVIFSSKKRKVTVKYKVHSQYQKLPVTISIKKANIKLAKNSSSAVKPISTKLIGARKFQLLPGQSRVVTLKLTLLPTSKPGLAIGKHQKQLDSHSELLIEKQLGYAQALQRLSLSSRKVSQDSFKFPVTYQYGISWVTVLLIGASTLFGLAVIGRYLIFPISQRLYYLISPAPLYGRLAFFQAPNGEKLPRPVSLAGRKGSLVIGKQGDVELHGGSVKDRHAEIYAVWQSGKPTLYVRNLEGKVNVANSPIEVSKPIIREVELKSGARLEIGGYKLRWI